MDTCLCHACTSTWHSPPATHPEHTTAGRQHSTTCLPAHHPRTILRLKPSRHSSLHLSLSADSCCSRTLSSPAVHLHPQVALQHLAVPCCASLNAALHCRWHSSPLHPACVSAASCCTAQMEHAASSPPAAPKHSACQVSKLPPTQHLLLLGVRSDCCLLLLLQRPTHKESRTDILAAAAAAGAQLLHILGCCLAQQMCVPMGHRRFSSCIHTRPQPLCQTHNPAHPRHWQ